MLWTKERMSPEIKHQAQERIGLVRKSPENRVGWQIHPDRQKIPMRRETAHDDEWQGEVFRAENVTMAEEASGWDRQ